MNLIVSVSDAKCSNDPSVVLVTYSLGSCIGVALHDPVTKLGGLLHYQLPSSTLDANKARENPLMFADTGLAWLIQEMEKMGASRKRMKVKLAGGAQILNDAGIFNIGSRNHAAVRKLFWQLGMFVEAEDVGGKSPRTVYLSVADGSLAIKTPAESKTI